MMRAEKSAIFMYIVVLQGAMEVTLAGSSAFVRHVAMEEATIPAGTFVGLS
jgi:hypothetical protein